MTHFFYQNGYFFLLPAGYHGASYEGNECDAILDGIDGLRNSVANASFAPRATRSSTAESLRHPAEPFIEMFQALKNLKEKVFGYSLKEGWEDSIRLFTIAHKASGNASKLVMISIHIYPFICLCLSHCLPIC